ncbi:MAG: DUF177 domain-containing protein [Dehalococcoidia bacterium]|nr:DUF177 domain-containing protein [Dehalococcoidia bacterium]
MLFNVAQLLKEPDGAERAYTVAERPQPHEADQPVLVEGRVRFMRTDKGIWANGVLRVLIAATCSRCLGPVDLPLTFELDEEYLPLVDVATGLPITDAGTDTETFRLDERHNLDLREAVRQYTLAGTPMKPLCKDDCRGLCPDCGANRNESDCGCADERRDLRLQVLKEMLSGKAATKRNLR